MPRPAARREGGGEPGREAIEAGGGAEAFQHPVRAARPRRRRRAGSPISAARASASAGGSPGGTSRPLTPSSISSGIAAIRRRDRGELHGTRLHQHVRQAVAVAIGGDPAREHEQIGAAGRRPAPDPAPARPASDPVAEAELPRLASSSSAQRAAADMDVAPVQVRRQQRQRFEQHLDALLRHRPGEPQELTGPAGSLPSGRPAGARRKALGIEAMVGRARPGRPAQARADATRCRRVQVTSQRQSASFSRFSHSGVVQMSLACAERAPGQPAQQGRVARRPRPACAGNGRGAGPTSAGSSAASTSAWPKRRTRLAVRIALEIAQPRRRAAG